MSHLLLVQGEDPSSIARLFRRGIALYKTIHKLEPLSSAATSSGAVAIFPRYLSPTPGLICLSVKDRWICGAGTWFYEGVSNEDALRRIAERWYSAGSASGSDRWLNDVDGYFAIALQTSSHEFAVITDRLGHFHIYQAAAGSCLLVSTSSIVLSLLGCPEWDTVGCRQFLAAGAILEPGRTLFKGIQKLGPAGVFRFARGHLNRSSKYWELPDAMSRSVDSHNGVSPLAAALREAVTVVVHNFPRSVVDLSGGIDTRGILGAVLQAGLDLDFVVNGANDDPDVIASKRIAKEFQLRHEHAHCGFSSSQEWWDHAKASLAPCDGELDILYYAGVLQVHRRLAERFDASVNGCIGEICQGHWWEVLFPFMGKRGHFDVRSVASRRLIGDDDIPGLLAVSFPQSLTDFFADVARHTNVGLEHHPNTDQMDNVYLTFWEQRFYGRTVSATSHIWPSVSPYGFRAPLEAALSAPPSVRARRRMSRRLVEYQSPQLAGMPLEHGYPASPLRFTNAHHFVPLVAHYGPMIGRRLAIQLGLGRWVMSGYRASHERHNGIAELRVLDEVRDLTDPDRMVSRELYDAERLRQVLDDPRYERRLGRILTLELLGRLMKANRSVEDALETLCQRTLKH